MTDDLPETWTGCHGVRLSGLPLEIGRASGTPLAEATVAVGAVPPPSGPELWHLHDESDAGGVHRTVDRWLCNQDGLLVVHASAGPSLTVDARTDAITVEPGAHTLTLQLIASFAVPLVLNGRDVVVLHASAVAKDGHAVVVCGKSGTGKSSVLIRMVEAGWEAVTEDVCAIDLGGDVPVAWPGPPWVRRAHGEPGPAGADLRFDTPDKAAWNLEPLLARGPVPVAHLVFLDPPGGETPHWKPLRQPEAVRDLAGHAAWLRDPVEAPGHLFGLALALTRCVPSSHLRMPRSSAWLDGIPDLLATRLG
ncbi:MAG: hypothetical protein JO148_04745 [Acidimicrobiia bacterium]|nr:hypothetical protein [Acidimicrobiia bacterium]